MVVAHYCGHRMTKQGAAGSLVPANEHAVARALAEALDALDVTAAFGSLASGADILVAEAVLARGSELHVILPFGPRRFKAEAVTPSGEGWEGRFDVAVRRASSIEVLAGEVEATIKAYADAAGRAMDRAVLRARMLGVEPVQIALWDGKPPLDGSTVDAELTEWQSTGLHSCVVPPSRVSYRKTMGAETPAS
jgi:adenylate cyclase